MIGEIGLAITLLSLGIWIGLLCFRGQFWRSNEQLEVETPVLETYPSICAVIPARNEAEMLPITLRSLLDQDYPGSLTVILVDDGSTDGTAKVAQSTAESLKKSSQLYVISAEPLPSGWSGKLWAMQQGIEKAQALTPVPEYFLLTDADIAHDSENLRRLVAKAQKNNLDLVSLMVLLRCESFWEKLLIPAFVFFFEKLYPFAWVNDPKNTTAAAAGGCILIRREALTRIGGIDAVRQALIDDCALAKAVKSTGNYKENGKGGIWLGLTPSTRSLRPYDSLSTIWDMVARTAFTQLNYSPVLLLGTLIAMVVVYIVSPVAAIIGALIGNWLLAIAGLLTWLIMALAYLPTIRLYGRSPLYALSLPAIALLYTFMTVDSAFRHWQGRGGAWKGRVYKEL